LRRKVSDQTKLPGNWIDFLRDPENKKELFGILASKVAKFVFEPGRAVYMTSAESVKHIGTDSSLSDCNHAEAETRSVVHILHALEHGSKTVQVRTVDTDVVIILAGAFCELIKIQ
jgi:hypothetical protein